MTSSTSYDAFLRHFLSQPEFIRDYLEREVPEGVKSFCDFSTLKSECETFVDVHHHQYCSDVLFSCSTVSGDLCYILVLIEHRPMSDRHWSFRMLRYAIDVMQNRLDAGDKQLPLVIPFLFNSDKSHPSLKFTSWLDGFSAPDVAATLYGGPFPQVNVSAHPEHVAVNHKSMMALHLLHKHVQQHGLMNAVDQLETFMGEGGFSSSFIASLVTYLIQWNKTPDAEAFVRELAKRVPQHGETLMNIAKQLEQSSYDKGVEDGMAEGEHTAMLRVARKMLEHGLDRSSVKNMTGLSEEDLLQNLTWR